MESPHRTEIAWPVPQDRLEELVREAGRSVEVLILRPTDGQDVALVSDREFRSMVETLDFIRSRRNVELLWSALDDIEAGRAGAVLTPEELTAWARETRGEVAAAHA